MLLLSDLDRVASVTAHVSHEVSGPGVQTVLTVARVIATTQHISVTTQT